MPTIEHPPNYTKFCKNCVHCSFDSQIPDNSVCTRDVVTTVYNDSITGKLKSHLGWEKRLMCNSERLSEVNGCGPDAKFYEEKSLNTWDKIKGLFNT